ncbi:TIGR02099 family protein [Permianibacter sp. IMCC34836]|uniref:YhdP family protein n=1 Tax=Permianibacter fluminis TaxID=2738515 RepID=UPI0015564D5E|nr:YhdP family protein [Permianibacter fluminis]NQD39011.1 TIGR02099 family protein [Permianibacter fluminis]
MIKRSLKWLWYVIAALIISVAVLVSIGRLLLPQAYRLKPEFENYLAVRTGAKVRIGEVYGVWRGYGPEIRVRDIQLLAPETDEPLLTIGRFEAALDIPRSIFSLHTVMRRFEVEGLNALVEFDSKGSLVLPGLVIESGEDSDISAQYVIDALLRQSKVAITQTEIRYRRRQGDIISLSLPDISLRNARGQHQAIGELQVHEGGTAKFVLEFTDYPLAPSDQMALYVESKALDLARLPLPTAALGTHLDDGDLQLQIWANWREGGWRDGQANLLLKQLQLTNDEQQHKQVEKLSGRLHFARADGDTWYLHGDEVRWQNGGEKHAALTIEGKVQRDGDGQRWGFDIGALALADIVELVRFSSAVPTDVRQKLAELNASAELPRLQIDFRLQDETLADWAVASQFAQLRYASQQLPEIQDLAGRILVAEIAGVQTGAARIKAKDQPFDFHQLFRAPLPVSHLDLAARWQQQAQQWLVTMPQLLLGNADAEIAARASLSLPDAAVTTEKPQLALAAVLRNGVGANKSAYLPVSVMTPELVRYLDGAIETATVTEAQALLRGPLGAFPFAQHEGVFDLQAQVNNARYQFQPDWPAVTDLSAELQFTADSMHIGIQRGLLAGLRINQGQVVLDPLGGSDTVLQVEANGSGNGQSALALLHNSPLRDALLPLTDTLDINGMLNTDLALSIPLHHERPAQVRGKVSFANATLHLKPIDLPLTGARGEVQFAEYGVTAGDVQLNALGGTVRASVSGDQGGGKIAFTGTADSAAIAAWYPHPMQQRVLGQFDYRGQVLLPGTEQQGVQVELRSDLSGVAVMAPAPFGKAANETAALAFNAGIQSGRLSLQADYRQQLAFQAERNGDEPLHSEFLLGGTAYAGHQPGLSIRGRLDKISAADWIPFVADLVSVATSNTKAAANTVSAGSTGGAKSVTPAPTTPIATTASSSAPALALSIAMVDFYGLPIADVDLGGRESADAYQLDVRAATVVGELDFAGNKPIKISLEKFLHDAPAEPAASESAPTEVVATATVPEPVPQREPADWPELEIDCKQCRFYSRELGHVQVSLRNQAADKTVRVQADRNSMLTAKLEGLWSASSHRTQLSGRVASRDWGKLTRDWGVDLSVRDSPGHVDLELAWPQSPVDFRLRDSVGKLELDLGKGSIARGSDNAEKVLRVFSLLSLQSITRRLSLDFSDLFRDGFFYDGIRGSFRIADGKARTDDTLIDGVSAAIVIRGETDFVARTLNQQIEVTPKLSSSLPILAGWAINPPAGLVVWLMNKLFIEPAVKVVTGLQYTVRGPWDNPEVIERGRTEKEVPIPEEGLPEPGGAVPPAAEPNPATSNLTTPTPTTSIPATSTAATASPGRVDRTGAKRAAKAEAKPGSKSDSKSGSAAKAKSGSKSAATPVVKSDANTVGVSSPASTAIRPH